MKLFIGVGILIEKNESASNIISIGVGFQSLYVLCMIFYEMLSFTCPSTRPFILLARFMPNIFHNAITFIITEMFIQEQITSLQLHRVVMTLYLYAKLSAILTI